jgi:hypothetical protein
VINIACGGYRASATANRSLPDIPVDSERIQLESGETLWENNEPNGDTSSELYATVEDNKHVTQPLGDYRRNSSLNIAVTFIGYTILCFLSLPAYILILY